MDVCQLTLEQQEKLIEDLLVLKDAVPLEDVRAHFTHKQRPGKLIG